MCTLCQSLDPLSDTYDFHGLTSPSDLAREIPLRSGESVGVTTGQGGSSKPVYSLDQIALQLTDGYWGGTGRSDRSFQLDAERTLVVDLEGLTGAGQYLAVNALQAWSEVTGITFQSYEPAPVGATIFEGADAPANTSTSASMQSGQSFRGTLSAPGDSDWIAISLVAGERYTVSLSGDASGNRLSDPFLRVYNANGTQVAFNDDAQGLDSQLTYTAASSGTYYLGAGSYNNASAGDYVLSVSDGAFRAADITFDDEESGAFASSVTSGGRILSSFVNISTAWLSSSGTSLTSYSFQTYLHEIGHALGLGHSGNYNGSASYANDAIYANDSWQTTVMSYFSESENTFTNANFRYVSTPQIADILAVHNLYGAQGARTGNTTYGVGATADAASADIMGGQAVTLYDGGGVDHIDLSTRTNNQRLDLNAETFSDTNGYVGNLAIARGTVIENATTGSGADIVIGNNADNRIMTSGGNDTVYGRGGNDTLIGDVGNDILYGEVGSDRLVGGGGNDALYGGYGNDRLEGGFGDDELFGEIGDDVLFGGYQNDTLSGGEGEDRLYGQDGNDNLVGGDGRDYLFGGDGNDTLAGGDGNDVLQGEAGNDTIFGASGNDLLAGGEGSDRLFGQDGDDLMTGGGGVDYLLGGAGADRLEGGGAGDVLRGGTQNDILIGGTGDDHLFGEDDDDVIYGQTGADRIIGGRGNDRLDGGADSDTFVFANGFGTDIITDFEVGVDLIDLLSVSDITDFSDLLAQHLSYTATGATITAGVNSIFLDGLASGSLTENDFIF